MKRQFLFSFYETPQGKLLQRQENSYLSHSITVSCKQTILQIGALGWETDFIDCRLYRYFYILDAHSEGSIKAARINGKSHYLPIQSETVDLVILPHLLEFDAHRFQTMREIERVLKPGGELIILNLNQVNIWVRMQFLWNKKMSDSWWGYFISRSRMTDWLKLLNYEIMSTAEFTIDNRTVTLGQFKWCRNTFFSMAYAIRAIKRQFTLIPLTSPKVKRPRLTPLAPSLNQQQSTQKYD